MKSMKLFALVISATLASANHAEARSLAGGKVGGFGGRLGRKDGKKRRPEILPAKQQQHFDDGLNSKDRMI